ncbi:uncharacterized protein LOC143182955 [Calliopsis andreniformis]|uniref:uncharacterized protein LOC143182955 n=1 Tax=Calliopsis andreniformis TaxID=337506 RepID=UPI003FCE4849
MKWCQLLFILFILYYNEQCQYGVFCTKINSVKPSTSTKNQLPDLHNDQNEPKSAVRSQRELKNVDLMTNSDDSVKQERTSRTLIGARRHLRPHDAHQVANYFLAGGPLKGHTHFVQSSNCDSNNADESIVGMSSPSNEGNTDSITINENSNTNSSDSIVGAPQIHTPLFHMPALYKPSSAKLQPLLQLPLNLYGAVPHIPRASLLHSVLHPNLHPHINRLRTIPSSLIRAATLPVQGLLHAQTELNKILLPTLPLHHPLHLPIHQPLHLPIHQPLQYPLRLPVPSHNKLVGSTSLLQHGKIRDNSLGDLTQLQSTILGAAPTDLHHKVLSNVIHPNLFGHPEPIGYVLKYVPHTNKELSSSPTVGSMQQQPSNCINSDLDTDQTIVGSVKNADEETNEPQQEKI